jgi:hypothetical protein
MDKSVVLNRYEISPNLISITYLSAPLLHLWLNDSTTNHGPGYKMTSTT